MSDFISEFRTMPAIKNNIPFYFRDISRYPNSETGEKTTDRLTGLPIMHDHIRSHLVDNFSKAVKEGKGWMMVVADADDLKTANKKSRKVGDKLIVRGTEVVVNAFDPKFFSQDAEIFAVRPTHAADEVLLLAVNVTPEEIETAKVHHKEIERPIYLEEDDFTSSISSRIYTSQDEKWRGAIRVHNKLLNEGAEHAYDFFKAIETLGEREVAVVKIKKELKRVLEIVRSHSEASRLNIPALIEVIISKIGGKRVAPETLAYCFQLVALEAEGFDTTQLGVDLSPEKLKEEFDKIFSKGEITI